MEFTPEMEVDRTRPHAELDGTDTDPRLSRYREQMVLPAHVLKHPLADEGSYFVTNNAQTGLATAAAPVAFSATNPFLIVYNKSTPSDDFNLRTYLDYAMLLATAAGTGGASVQFAVTLDRGNRYTSGGTEITANNVVTGPSNASGASITRVWAGNITASAASSSSRTIVGNRFLKGAIPVAGDEYTIRCGSASCPDSITISTIMKTVVNLPPIIVGPDESALFHIWLPSQSAASSYAPELGWWER